MVSGGGRARSGPPADPMALRRDRKDDAAWVTLPAAGFDGEVPEWPVVFGVPSGNEAMLWADLWRKPQAVMWSRLGMSLAVASYTRALLESIGEKSSAGLKTAVLRMEAELGLSLPGMHSLRWKFSEDELAAKREDAAAEVSVPSGARDRLRALDGA